MNKRTEIWIDIKDQKLKIALRTSKTLTTRFMTMKSNTNNSGKREYRHKSAI